VSHAGPGCRVQHGCEGAGHHWFTPNGAVRTWHQLGRVGGAVHWVSHSRTSGLMAREQSALPALCNCDVGVHKRVLSALLVVLAAITQLTLRAFSLAMQASGDFVVLTVVSDLGQPCKCVSTAQALATAMSLLDT